MVELPHLPAGSPTGRRSARDRDRDGEGLRSHRPRSRRTGGIGKSNRSLEVSIAKDRRGSQSPAPSPSASSSPLPSPSPVVREAAGDDRSSIASSAHSQTSGSARKNLTRHLNRHASSKFGGGGSSTGSTTTQRVEADIEAKACRVIDTIRWFEDATKKQQKARVLRISREMRGMLAQNFPNTREAFLAFKRNESEDGSLDIHGLHRELRKRNFKATVEDLRLVIELHRGHFSQRALPRNNSEEGGMTYQTFVSDFLEPKGLHVFEEEKFDVRRKLSKSEMHDLEVFKKGLNRFQSSVARHRVYGVTPDKLFHALLVYDNHSSGLISRSVTDRICFDLFKKMTPLQREVLCKYCSDGSDIQYNVLFDLALQGIPPIEDSDPLQRGANMEKNRLATLSKMDTEDVPMWEKELFDRNGQHSSAPVSPCLSPSPNPESPSPQPTKRECMKAFNEMTIRDYTINSARMALSHKIDVHKDTPHSVFGVWSPGTYSPQPFQKDLKHAVELGGDTTINRWRRETDSLGQEDRIGRKKLHDARVARFQQCEKRMESYADHVTRRAKAQEEKRLIGKAKRKLAYLNSVSGGEERESSPIVPRE